MPRNAHHTDAARSRRRASALAAVGVVVVSTFGSACLTLDGYVHKPSGDSGAVAEPNDASAGERKEERNAPDSASDDASVDRTDATILGVADAATADAVDLDADDATHRADGPDDAAPGQTDEASVDAAQMGNEATIGDESATARSDGAMPSDDSSVVDTGSVPQDSGTKYSCAELSAANSAAGASQRLENLGYYRQYSTYETALKAFQLDQGQGATGRLAPATVEALMVANGC